MRTVEQASRVEDLLDLVDRARRASAMFAAASSRSRSASLNGSPRYAIASTSRRHLRDQRLQLGFGRECD